VAIRKATVELPSSLIVTLLPNMFSLVKSIHALWVPELHKQYVPAEFEETFALDDAVMSTLMGKAPKSRTEPHSRLKGLRSFLEYSRDYW
jgi:hypothetical protein